MKIQTSHHYAKTPIDVACWDLFGKSAGLPVCDLLGGRTPLRLPVISSIHTGEPEDMRQRVDDLRRRGYLGHSIKVGDVPERDAARITACLADKQPEEFFIVDANGGLAVESALRTLRLLPPGLDFVLEAPCATWRECQSLRRRTDVPIYMDELADSDAAFIRAVADDAADGINLKISKSGGLTKARRQRDIALAAGYALSIQDTTGSDIAFAAIVHLGQTVPEKFLRCVLDCREITTKQTAFGDFEVVNGCVSAPEAPGLGIAVDRAALGAPVARYE